MTLSRTDAGAPLFYVGAGLIGLLKETIGEKFLDDTEALQSLDAFADDADNTICGGNACGDNFSRALVSAWQRSISAAVV